MLPIERAMTILEEIVAHKRAEVSRKKAGMPKFELRGLADSRDFASALKGKDISLIAEIKKFSPSKRALRVNFDPAQIAKDYEGNGAAAISVLTDEKFFGGKDSYIRAVRQAVELPILRKEFIVDEYQIYESRFLGADGVLLIASIWGRTEMISLLVLAEELGLSVLVEAHTEEEVAKILSTPAKIIGINNRNLATLEVDLTTSLRLRRLIPPDRIAISESGVRTREDILRLEEAGFDGVLIGESLMSSPDGGSKLRELLGK
jgi:indole-3-glycerol phosphate synthase